MPAFGICTRAAYLESDTIYSIAALISSSLQSPQVPLGGIAFRPFQAPSNKPSIPFALTRGSQSAAAPNLGAPATPIAWQAVHLLSYKLWPVRGPAATSTTAAAQASPAMHTEPTGLRRSANSLSSPANTHAGALNAIAANKLLTITAIFTNSLP